MAGDFKPGILPSAIIRVARDEIISEDSFFGSVNRADYSVFRSGCAA